MSDAPEPFVHVALRAEPLEPAAITERVRRPDCGAIVTFEGTVRTPDRGREVLRLQYEAYHDRAIRQLDQIAREVMDARGARAVAIEHRTGTVEAARPAIVVSVAAPHRAEAFGVATELMDRIKAEVAIWKQEFDRTGGTWIEC